MLRAALSGHMKVNQFATLSWSYKFLSKLLLIMILKEHLEVPKALYIEAMIFSHCNHTLHVLSQLPWDRQTEVCQSVCTNGSSEQDPTSTHMHTRHEYNPQLGWSWDLTLLFKGQPTLPSQAKSLHFWGGNNFLTGGPKWALKFKEGTSVGAAECVLVSNLGGGKKEKKKILTINLFNLILGFQQ